MYQGHHLPLKHSHSGYVWLAPPQAGGAQYVLRKKPPGQVLASAHAVEREFQVLAALKDTPVPVPMALCLCQDSAVIGTPFYIMEHVQVRPSQVSLVTQLNIILGYKELLPSVLLRPCKI